MKKKTKALLFSLFIGVILLYYFYSKYGILDVLQSFKNFNLRTLAIYIFAILAIEFFLLVRWVIILKSFKYNIPWGNLFLYKLAGYSVGYLSPQPHIGGEPIRALLLKRHGIGFKEGISTVVIDKSMQMTTDLLFSIIGFILIALHFSVSKGIEILAIIVILTFMFLLSYYFYSMIKKKPFFSAVLRIRFLKRIKTIKKIIKHVEDVENTIHTFYKDHMHYFIYVIFINLTLYVLMFLEYSTALRLFGFEPSIYIVLIIMGGVALSYMMPMPMAIGVLETSQVGALGMLKLDEKIGLSISILIRIKDLLRSLIGASALAYYGIDRHAKNGIDEEDIPAKKAKDKIKA